MECWLQLPPPAKCPSFPLPGLSQLKLLSFAGTSWAHLDWKGQEGAHKPGGGSPDKGGRRHLVPTSYIPPGCLSAAECCRMPTLLGVSYLIHSGPALSSLKLWGLKLNIVFSINNLNWQQAHWMWSFAYKLKPAVVNLRLPWNRFRVARGLQFCATSQELV